VAELGQKLWAGQIRRNKKNYSKTCTSLEKNYIIICKIKEIICKKLPKKSYSPLDSSLSDLTHGSCNLQN
jgi:hypothetical protein